MTKEKSEVSQNSLKFKDNPFQYTRGIRFQVEPNRQGKLFKEKSSLTDNPISLSELATTLLDFQKELKVLLFYSKESEGRTKLVSDSTTRNKENSLKFQKGISINKWWFKIWYKDIFYLWIKNSENTQGKYPLNNLEIEIESWICNWYEKSCALKRFGEQPQDEKIRHSEIAEVIRFFLNRNQWDYIDQFLTELNTKEAFQDQKIRDLKNSLEKIRKNLKLTEQIYSRSQSSGIEIAKASFNYFTLNKKPKEYYDNELSKTKKKLSDNNFSKIILKKESYEWSYNRPNGNSIVSDKLFCFKNDPEKEWIKRYVKQKISNNEGLFSGNGVKLSLDQTYTFMKAFKAEQKSIFYEVMAHITNNKGSSYEVKNNNHTLKGYKLPYDHLNCEKINNVFSLFQFSEYEIKNTQSPTDKILSVYKNQEGKVTKEKCYEVFLNLTKNNPIAQKKMSQHPKHRFLNRRNKFSRREETPQSYSVDRKKGIQNSKKERGQFLFGKACYFKEYGDFCEIYKNIAQQRGRLIAQIKGIEREKQESQQTDFWSLIYCDRNKKQLWLVPKEQRKEARKFINGQVTLTTDSVQYLCYFESLTMRALHKLCFAEQSSFVTGMPSDLKTLQKEAKECQTKGEEQKLKEKDQKKLKFLKELLKSNYANEKLDLQSFNLQSTLGVKDIQKFEENLEQACYHIKKVALTEKEKQNFLEKFDVTVLEISSYDLKGRNKNTHQSPVSPDRLHTNLWKDFWHNVSQFKGESKKNIDNASSESVEEKKTEKGFFNIRLNPEIKIRYRKENQNLKEYFRQKNFPKKFKHRQLKEQWTIHFTLALNAGKKYDPLAFSKPEEILEKIKSFNEKLNQEMIFKKAWKYGIDRGQKELATLCLAKFNSEDTYKVENKTIVKPTFPNGTKDIKCWTLKDCAYVEGYTTKAEEIKKRYAVKNLSYFIDEKYMNNTKLFKKENITCLDLTVAKVIKGKIITNGDILTYLKLKKTVAKRQIYELFHKGNIQQGAKLKWSEWENGKVNNDERKRPEGVLNIKTSNGEKTIYYYIKKYEGIPLILDKNGDIQIAYNQDSVERALNSYLNQLRQNNNSHSPSILQVNHLREAITANMVGVICYLQKEYPGFIILEDLSKSHIDKNFFKNNENIARRLEYALYNKFQTLGLVPPHVKDIIQLREKTGSQNQKNKKNRNHKDIQQKQGDKGKLSQIGAIVFVSEENTSKTCPYCEKIKTAPEGRKQKEEFKKSSNDEKFRQHRFICNESSCGFDTYLFKASEERVRDPNPEVDESKKDNFTLFKDISDNDKVAAYNIAKKEHC